MGKKVQDDRIVVRIDTKTKELFTKICLDNEITPSDYLRSFILDAIENGYKEFGKNNNDDNILKTIDLLKEKVNQIESLQDEYFPKLQEFLIKHTKNEDKLR